MEGRSKAAPLSEVFHRPLHPYTVSLLGAVPTMTTDRNSPLATLPAETDAARGALVELAPGHWVRQARIRALTPHQEYQQCTEAIL